MHLAEVRPDGTIYVTHNGHEIERTATGRCSGTEGDDASE